MTQKSKLIKVGGFSLCAALVIIAAAGCSKGGSKDLKTVEQKASYAIGQHVGKGIKNQGFDIDPDIVAMSIRDVLDGNESKLSQEEMQKVIRELRTKARKVKEVERQANKEKGDKFLADNKSKEGVKVTQSGLQYKVLSPGKGKPPTDKQWVKVNYKGTLIDGTEFDSSYKRNKPAEFPVRGVIKGWTEALQMMKPGAKWKLFIPPDLAYGPRDRPNIPGNSTLLFEVELLDAFDKKTQSPSFGGGGKKPAKLPADIKAKLKEAAKKKSASKKK